MIKSAKFLLLSMIGGVFFFPLNLMAYDSPYKNPVFRNVLGKAKLQFPKDKIRIGYGRFQGRAKPYFYLENGRYMTFKVKKASHGPIVRAELRLGPEDWSVYTPAPKILNAEIHLSNPKGLDQITLLQIHAVKPSYPPLRITWLRSHRGIKNHVWAILRASPYHNGIRYADLGKRQGKNFSRYSIKVSNGNLEVWSDWKLKAKQSLALWKGTKNYFKAGVYLSGKGDGGLAKARFRLLEYR
ncbi:MAG: polysaccharide lyase family 7 protein [Cocleimonas sp.]|nr:polysaccharide lyase family 7 protein [Cocleimonas sp.]